MSLCFYDDYYFDGRQKTDEDVKGYMKYRAMDIYGDLVSTTPALTMYKVWFESFFKAQSQFNTRFFNCTEDGILGVMPKPIVNNGKVERLEPVYIPWMSILPLDRVLEAYTTMFKEQNK